MKQVLQHLGNGETLLAEVPCPRRAGGSLLTETSKSLVSLGTEKMLIDFGRGSLLAKARSQPDKVKQVIQKIRTDGLWTTLEAVKAKLDVPIPLGYCNVGRIVETDPNSAYRIGDRIASNGPHAEVVSIPKNLAARIPDNVSDDAAAFTVVAAIGMQGIRLLNPTLGERVVVSGLGLIGLLTVQMLRANGCRVLGIDLDERKLALARQFGAETVDLSAGQDPVRAAEAWTNGIGVDGVIITASAKSNDIVHQAASMCRKRGRIVLVGVVGLNLQRADFYEKELSFQVSCSYGPGRYDENYEKRGIDYPIGFIRWTEQRNFDAVLQLMAEGKIDVAPLITHEFEFANVLDAYAAISEPSAMGIVLDYGPSHAPESSKFARSIDLGDKGSLKGSHDPSDHRGVSQQDLSIAFVGAGGFTTRMLLPLLPKTGITRSLILSGSGVSAAQAAKKFSFQRVASEFDEVLSSTDVDAVFIATPHHLHASMVCEALAAGKHVFVEKPLALNLDDLDRVALAMQEYSDLCVMVGYNRRFSPHTRELVNWLQGHPSSKAIVITINAGAIPAEHWTQDSEVGGGRILGEACHFIDLARHLANSPIESVNATFLGGSDGRQRDAASIQMSFGDGSIATVHYLSNGSKDFPKERIEVFAGGDVYVCNNFKRTQRIGNRRSLRTSKQDKGHAEELRAFIHAIRQGGEWPIPKSELIEVARATIQANGTS